MFLKVHLLNIKKKYPLIEYEDFEKFVLFKDSVINMKYLIKLFKKYNIK